MLFGNIRICVYHSTCNYTCILTNYSPLGEYLIFASNAYVVPAKGKCCSPNIALTHYLPFCFSIFTRYRIYEPRFISKLFWNFPKIITKFLQVYYIYKISPSILYLQNFFSFSKFFQIFFSFSECFKNFLLK